MKTYLISYDLHRPGQKYDELYEAIKNLGTWSHCLDSVWIIKTDLSATQIRDSLSPQLDGSDSLLVVLLAGGGAWIGLDVNCSSWLKNNL